MTVDPQLRAELGICEQFQIPHSHYLGGPDRWTPLDREKAEEYTAWKLGACPSCGTRHEEFDEMQGGDRFAYIATTHRCTGCELIEMERENVPTDAKGVKISLIPNPDLYEPTDPVSESLVT